MLTVASNVPAVRDAAAVVAGLAKLAEQETAGPGSSGGGGSDRSYRRGSSREREREGWVGWCGSIVQALERADQVLGQVKERESERAVTHRSQSCVRAFFLLFRLPT